MCEYCLKKYNLYKIRISQMTNELYVTAKYNLPFESVGPEQPD